MKKQNIDPAALLVLHTWNQELGHHPHVHAIIPGAGPSWNRDNDRCWVTARDQTKPWRTEKPSLVDNVALGRTFRDKFVRGLGWLIRNGKLKLNEEWQLLEDPKVLSRWLKSLCKTDWNVFIEGPPHGKSDPLQVVKYLTRYLTGGPISDQRIESDEQGMVTFLARSNSRQPGQKLPPRRIKVTGSEFVRRWSMHILPKGFTRSRGYGGYHGSRRKVYLETCRKLLPEADPQAQRCDPPATSAAEPKCPKCQIKMNCIVNIPRPSWRMIFGERAITGGRRISDGRVISDNRGVHRDRGIAGDRAITGDRRVQGDRRVPGDRGIAGDRRVPVQSDEPNKSCTNASNRTPPKRLHELGLSRQSLIRPHLPRPDE